MKLLFLSFLASSAASDAFSPPSSYLSSSALQSTHAPLTNAALDKYKQEHQHSITDPASFWDAQAQKYLSWSHKYNQVLSSTNIADNPTWFAGGKLNVCYNAVDRHVENGRGEQTALVFEGDEPTDTKKYTFAQLQARISQIAGALRAQGVQPGDVVTIYMPMVPDLPLTMLACARLGAVHSVVFAGFSAEALGARLKAAQSKYLVTADIGKRGGKTIALYDIAQQALSKVEHDVKTMVWERFYDGESKVDLQDDNHIAMNPLVDRQRPYLPPVERNSEDPLFILYTSGSTGQPKGLVHTTAGYALYAAFTTATTFLLAPNDLFACVADCGWITGHTYTVYGPLLNGVATLVFESTPLYPDAGRYWDLIDRHRVTQFYTAPTALRSLMRFGNDIPAKYQLDSLKVLGSVGEPINAAAWEWYYRIIGREKCTVVDTYWQTETGGHLLTNIPGVTPMKPGSCTLPMYGIDPVVLDAVSGEIVSETECEGVLAIRQPWPGMARTCLGDHERYQTVYLKPYPGYYFTGDAVMRDKDGYHFITGRVDDVLNVSGHRIGTAEVESALVAHPAVAQAAVVGKSHPVKGEAITGFVMLDVNHEDSLELVKELRNQVRTEIGPFASPDHLWVVPSLPMTRSGKIMRRILRKIVAGETDSLGDTSTLADPSIVDVLIEKVEATKAEK